LEAEDFPIGAPLEFTQTRIEQIPEFWGTAQAVEGLTENDDPRTMNIWARYQRQAASPGTASAMIRSMMESDVRAVLPNLRVPTLVMWHESPANRAWEYAPLSRYLAEHIPDAKLLEIGGDQPAELNVFIDEIREFLTGVREESTDADRVLATVLFSDIVGSTELAARLGDREWGALLYAHHDVVRRQLERFRGSEVKTLGDGFLATFDGPARAIRCASAICDAARRLDLEVRVGLHTGEVEFREGDVGGIAVHIAARVAALAEASQVLVSRTVTDLVTGSGIRFDDAGTHELKGVPGAWQLFSVQPQ
jgi:class 3 adenylate cyclase